MFPTNPSEGQLYKNYIFSSNRWVNKDNYDFGDGSMIGTLHRLPYEESTRFSTVEVLSQGSRKTYNCSTLVPVGAKAVLIKTMLHGQPSNTIDYAYVILGFSDTNTFAGSYSKNDAQASLIGLSHTAVNAYVGNGGAESVVKLDSNRCFYSYTNTFLGVSQANAYIVVLGYYI